MPAHLSCAQVAGHDHQGVAEVNNAAVAVCQAAVLQYLKENVEHVRVSLLYFVEEDYPEGMPSHGLRELPRLIVAHVARRRSHQPGHRVLLHVLRHVDTHHVLFVVKQELGQRAGQLRFANARWPQENEAADGPFGVLQAGA